MRQKYVMGNWKMHGSLASISTLLQNIQSGGAKAVANLVVLPPAIYLQSVRDILNQSTIMYGAQNVYPAVSGAYTGELAGPMLKEFGCQFVLVGHSERRQLFGETNALVAQKCRHVQDCGMIPVLCVGETLAQREQQQTDDVLAQQLASVYDAVTSLQGCVIAYEPVWAIGTGNTAMPDQIQAAHAMIRAFVAKKEPTVANGLSILYGGSVTPETAPTLFSLDNVDGGLVGGASLDADRFLGIAACIS